MNVTSVESWRRESCRLCDAEELRIVLPLKPVPIGEKYTNEVTPDLDRRYPIDLYECQSCSCVQTLDCVDSKFLWSDYTYYSGQTKGIVEHQTAFANSTVDKYSLDKDDIVFDIGSNDGTLLRAFRDRGCDVFGIDPAETVAAVAKSAGIDTHVGLFSADEMARFPARYQCGFASIVTAFNVFAHSENMQGMINGVVKALAPDGLFLFEVQYLKDILEKKLLGTIFHEHMIHYSVTSAGNFLERNGMKLIDVEINRIQKGSVIFTAVKKETNRKASRSVAKLRAAEAVDGCLDQSLFAAFSNHIAASRSAVRGLVAGAQALGDEIAGFGAARAGPTLAIQLGLEDTLHYLVDDHSSKVGKHAAFEGLKVISVAEFQARMPKLTFILAWLHHKKIIADNLDYLMRGGSFVLLWPEVAVVTHENYEHYAH